MSYRLIRIKRLNPAELTPVMLSRIAQLRQKDRNVGAAASARGFRILCSVSSRTDAQRLAAHTVHIRCVTRF